MRNKGICDSLGCNVWDWYAFWSPCVPIHAGEEISESLARWQGPYQIQMNVVKTCFREWKRYYRSFVVTRDLSTLALEAAPSPVAHVSIYSGPYIACGD